MLKLEHLVAVVAAFAILFAAVIGMELYIHQTENQYIHALAPERFQQKNQGSALQRVALSEADLLLIYGSSEVGPADVFRDYATGFSIFPVTKAGSTSLIYVQDLVALGHVALGKRIAISFTPGEFFFPRGPLPDYYAGNFSVQHAFALAFSPDLTFALKRDVARRMLEYPQTVGQDILLKFTLELLADDSLQSHVIYYGLLPLGLFQNLSLGLQDDWVTWQYIEGRPDLNAQVARRPRAVDWSSLVVQASKEAEQNATNNPFGFENKYWEVNRDELVKLKNSETDKQFIEDFNQSKEWVDLELLLRENKEMRTEPIILSMPIPGAFYDYIGISAQARQAYYEKLDSLAKSYDVPVIDFAGYDGDKSFLVDQWSHPSSKGWVLYERALDAFFHDQVSDGHE